MSYGTFANHPIRRKWREFKSVHSGKFSNPNRRPYSELLTRAALSSLYQQRLQNIVILMNKVKNGLVPTYITEIFYTTPKQYNLRNADFNIPSFRTVHYGKHSLRYFGPHLWNKLDKNHREKTNLKSFINSIKSKDLSHLIGNCKNCDICW